jgi:hypothetical protein
MMSRLRELMTERDMLSFGDPLPWPEAADYGVTNLPYLGTTDFGAHPNPALEAFEDACWAILQARLPEPGIACYKLCSNEPWWVRPTEINEALQQVERWPDPAYRFWADWLAYLRGAAQHDGFTVL